MKKLHKTFKNKMYSCGVILVGFISLYIGRDATILVLSLMVGTPIFFAKGNLFN